MRASPSLRVSALRRVTFAEGQRLCARHLHQGQSPGSRPAPRLHGAADRPLARGRWRLAPGPRPSPHLRQTHAPSTRPTDGEFSRQGPRFTPRPSLRPAQCPPAVQVVSAPRRPARRCAPPPRVAPPGPTGESSPIVAPTWAKRASPRSFPSRRPVARPVETSHGGPAAGTTLQARPSTMGSRERCAAPITGWTPSKAPQHHPERGAFFQPTEPAPASSSPFGKLAGPAYPAAVRVYASRLQGGRPDQTYRRSTHVNRTQPFWVTTLPVPVDGPMSVTVLAADGSEIPFCTEVARECR